MTQNNLCIIPARGNSKRIPRKNIKDFLGKPIIAYSIEAALASGLFSEVMVSTDDAEVAEIAKQYGASIPFMRSNENSNDYAPLSRVFGEVLDYYRSLGLLFHRFCSVLATAPLVTSDDLKGSFSLLSENNKSVVSIVEYDFPIQRFLRKTNDALEIGDRENYVKRSQDLEAMYHDAGQFYWADCEAYLESKSFFSLCPQGYELNKSRFFDIDTLEDWTKVESIYKYINAAEKRNC